MPWNKHGVIFRREMAQLPTVSDLGDRWRISYSSRDGEGRSFGSYFDCPNGKPHRILRENIGFISHGLPGSCDVAGTMPMQWLDGKLYYIGWTLRQDVPYFNYTCVAQQTAGGLEKRGPILAPNTIDQGYAGTFFVLPTGEQYLGYYLSSVDWIPDEAGAIQPCYDIKIARSDDGFSWTKLGRVAIPLREGEAGISSATIIELDGIYHMWFSVRGGTNFRQFSNNSYRIQHAISKDGLNWNRSDKLGIVADPALNENMCAYPSAILGNEQVFLFYNGLSFGFGGISLAVITTEVVASNADALRR